MYGLGNGLFFKRTSDGGVMMLYTNDGERPAPDFGNVKFTQEFSEDIWCSVISSVSAGGEIDGRWYAAKAFHQSTGSINITPKEITK